jgi:CubicO group peptidase (beta-lactamase class C family)
MRPGKITLDHWRQKEIYRKRVCMFIFLLLLFNSSLAQTSNTKQFYDFSSITNKIQDWVDSGYYPGASIIIAKDNKIIYEKYFGNYTPQTVAYIASAGKWLAAATIAGIVDEGKLSWDDKVKKMAA